MLIQTHLAITIFGILLLISNVENKLVFVLVALIATFIPDIDSKHSKLGRYFPFRFLQIFVKHRGIIHSFIFLTLITIILATFFPAVALGFFLGYSLHLFSDSFTVDGIKPFYPFNPASKGVVRVGSRTETGIFVFFVLANLALLFWKVFSVV